MKNTKTVADVPPSYRDAVSEVGKQLALRKSLITKRVFLILWPALLLIIFFYVGGGDWESIKESSFAPLIGGWIIFTVLYVIIMKMIFDIEKYIWIDSYFDKKNLPPSDSWHIAKKLLWPALMLHLDILARFYLIAILVCIIAIYLLAQLGFQVVLLLAILAAPFAFLIYIYYVRAKLRYIWFLFLDMYDPNFTHQKLFVEMYKLNDVMKTEMFKKALITNLGTDSVNMLAQSVVGLFSSSLGAFGKAGKLIGSFVGTFGNEMSQQATSFARITALYMFYRFSRSELYKKEQEVNEYIYKL